MENWLDYWAWGVLISDAKSSWQSVTSGVAWGSILGPLVFKLDDGMEAILSKYVDSAKLSGADQDFLMLD